MESEMIQVIVNASSDDVRVDPNGRPIQRTEPDAPDPDDTVDDDPRLDPKNRAHFQFHVRRGTRIGGWNEMFRR